MKKKKKMPSRILRWWVPPPPTDNFTCCPEIGTCGDRMQGREQHYKIPKTQYKIPPALQALPTVFFALHLRQLWTVPTWRPPAPFSCSSSPTSSHFQSQSSFKVQQHCSDSCFFAFLPFVGYQSCLWVLGLRWKLSRTIFLGFKIPFKLFFYNHRCTQQHCCDLCFCLTFSPLWVFHLVSVGVGFALKYLSTDFLGLKSLQTSVICSTALICVCLHFWPCA